MFVVLLLFLPCRLTETKCAGYRRTVLILVHQDKAPDAVFSSGGVYYALKQLKTVNSRSPTKVDLKMVDIVLKYLSSKDKISIITIADFALRWKDIKMWRTVITKSGSNISIFGAERLVRACKTFTFESIRTR